MGVRGSPQSASAPQREERSDEALSGSGPASDAVHRMHAVGKWQDVSAAVTDAGAEAFCWAVAEGR
jgi:hypothetical protein